MGHNMRGKPVQLMRANRSPNRISAPIKMILLMLLTLSGRYNLKGMHILCVCVCVGVGCVCVPFVMV